MSIQHPGVGHEGLTQVQSAEAQRIRDEEHVKLLGIFYYVSGGLSALFGLLPLFYVFVGAAVMAVPDLQSQQEAFAARAMGAMFASIGILLFVIAQAFAAAKFVAGYSLLRRRNRIACLVIAGITCLGFPFSTILGVFTFIVLLRPSVRELFDGREPAKELP